MITKQKIFRIFNIPEAIAVHLLFETKLDKIKEALYGAGIF